MELLTTIKNKLCYEYDKLRWKRNIRIVARNKPWQNVATIEETLEMLQSGCSICRYGDGEYKVMAGLSNGFQQTDSALASRLRQVLKSDVPGLMVCIPNIREDMQLRTPEAIGFWQWCIREWGGGFSKMLAPGKKYYNAHVTRLYMDYRTCGRSGDWFETLKQVWQGKDLLIVEGERTRLGVGNDLLDGANSIKRVLCPSKSAFSYYDKILETVKSAWNGELVLIAVGQTATVLAHDLHLQGIRALDIGHIDIEYEWFLAGAVEKTAVTGKFVKEVEGQLEGEADPVYLSQVAARVGV